jgi:hypothetical protein
MHKLISGLAAVLICSACGIADVANSAPFGRGAAGAGLARSGGVFHGAGGFHGVGQFHGVAQFHGGFHGVRGFYGRGLYPYTLFGYPNYHSYGGYYPYSIYEDSSPDCDFVWIKRTVKHKIVQRGIWTCS